MTTQTTSTATPTLTGVWDIDPAHSRIGFATKHAMVTTVRGEFKSYTADVTLDEEHPENSRIHLEIQTTSVETGNADRDKHLRGGDFFDVEKYPTIVFDATRVEQDDDIYTLIGDLTINGKTQPVSVEFEFAGATTDPWGGFRAGFEGRATINRRDWGLGWNVALDKGGVLVGEKIKLEFDISAVKRAS